MFANVTSSQILSKFFFVNFMLIIASRDFARDAI
jgi:hypothetical protein